MSNRAVLPWSLTILLLVACGGLVEQLEAQQKPERPMVLLWPEGAPGAVGTEDRDKPSLTIYLPSPARAVGTGVVVCPGGGYQNLALDHEGQQIAEWLNSMGVAAFVLRYRLAPRYRHPAPMQDVQRAIRLVRTRASEFGIAPDRIGVWGFSAGGHLASTAATHFDAGEASAADPINRAGSRPDFAILCYPVITFANEYQHGGSRRNLIGENPDPQLVELLSNEKQVTPQTPPTFLFHTTEDKAVPPENSVFFYLALRKAGVPAEMHIYEQGRHGVGLGHTDVALASWSERLAQWMMIRGLLRR
jgi:acetyl esterase/lipase